MLTLKEKEMTNKKFTIKDMVICSMFTVLITVGAFIKIPVPVCPFTLQFFFTTMAGLILGAKRGAISCALYAILGLIGLPLFAEGGGIWYLAKPTFGYIIGFIIGSYVTGKLAERKGWDKPLLIFVASFIGLLIVYACGMVYYYVIGNYIADSPIGIWALFLYCFLLAVPGDFVLCVLSALTTKRIRKALGGRI